MNGTAESALWNHPVGWREGGRSSRMRAALRVCCALIALGAAGAAPERLPAFEMEDQFGEVHTDADFRGGIVVFLVSDREGSRFNRLWSEALREKAQGRMEREAFRIVGAAHLKGVPKFMRGPVKNRFPRERERWVLLDWEGFFDGTYGLAEGASNLLVFDAGGRLIHRTSGRKPDQDEVESLLQSIRASLSPSQAFLCGRKMSDPV